MPYIKHDKRENVMIFGAENCGELNYELSMAVNEYIMTKGKSYQTFNDILGVLTAMQLEIYRRLVAPYEESKRCQNGEVFEE